MSDVISNCCTEAITSHYYQLQTHTYDIVVWYQQHIHKLYTTRQ